MQNFKNLIYILTCLSVSIIIGASIFEHVVIWPHSLSAPPASLAMFQGEYGATPGAFWPKIHPITILLFIITTILFWKSSRRKNILIVFIGYAILFVATTSYFVPEIISIVSTEYSTSIDSALSSRASLWENLSLLRLFVIFILVFYLFLGLTKSDGEIK